MKGLELRQAVESMFEVIRDRSSKDELVFICPQPGCGDASGNRSVNLKTGKTNCWRCNKGGDFTAWARFIGFDISDSGLEYSVPLEELDLRALREEETPLPVVQDVNLPKGFTYCHTKPKHIYTTLIGEMAERKNLSLDDFFEAKVGFTQRDPRWEPYAIFPVTEYERTVYYQGRTYCDVPGESTKLFPTRQECPASSKYWIYNIDELRSSKAEIALAMESILNVLTMRRFFREHGIANIVPICVFKHYISTPQVKKLLTIPALKEICLLYDHDATRNSWEKSVLISDRLPVTVAEMPPGPGGDKNDPNDDPASAWAAFERRQISDALSAIRLRVTGMGTRPKSKAPVVLDIPSNPLDNLFL